MITRLAPLLFAMGALAQDVPADHALLSRHYHDGETLTYRMKGTNERWQYEIQAAGVVKKNQNGKYTEEYAWSNLMSGGRRCLLPQRASNSASPFPSIPKSRHPFLICPRCSRC